ncbi:MAG: holo-ACP synthase [Lachnospiraceae bacterium]
MIYGVGIDMIEINRVKKACGKERFLERCYTIKEIEEFKGRYTELAGNFSVKEAVAKSLGTGFRGFELNEIEVLRDKLGKPYVNLYGNAKEKAWELGIKKIHVSITNVSQYVQALAVSENL